MNSGPRDKVEGWLQEDWLLVIPIKFLNTGQFRRKFIKEMTSFC